MKKVAIAIALVSTALLLGCAPYPAHLAQEQVISYPDIVHSYEFAVMDIDGAPIEGATAAFSLKELPTFSLKNKGIRTSGRSTKSEFKTDSAGKCAASLTVSQDPECEKYFACYKSEAHCTVTKDGFFLESGSLSSSYGSKHSSDREYPVTGQIKLYKPIDYLSENFAATSSDRELKEKTLAFISVIRLQSIIVDADLVLRGVTISNFKSKKYMQFKIDTTTTFNSLKLNKYDVAKRIFDETIRKVLNPLNDYIGDPKNFYGYDIVAFGHTKSFADEHAKLEEIEYRFLLPQDAVKKY